MKYLIELELDGYEGQEEEIEGSIQFIESALDFRHSSVRVLEVVEKTTAERIFDVVAPGTDIDVAISFDREYLQAAIDRLNRGCLDG